MSDPITIDVVSDVICPWCFLGKRRLDKAVSSLDMPVEIRWRPFQLDPSIPKEGIPRKAYLERKFGSLERIAELHKPLIAAGKQDGIDYAFDKIQMTPNTLNAHRLIRWSHENNLQNETSERLFNLYWLEGADIGSRDVLVKVAAEVGLDGSLVAQLLQSEADLDPVIAEINEASELGITGVPTFILAGRYGVVGAQSSEVLQGAIRRVFLEQQGKSAVSS